MGILTRLKQLQNLAATGPLPATPEGKASRPNLVICGAPRCGTSSLRYYLREHPDIEFIGGRDFEPIGGEEVGLPLNSPFVSHTHRASALETYDKACDRVRSKYDYIGISVRYAMYYPHIIHNIKHHLPGVRLLFILRNPIDRARSMYSHLPPEKRGQSFDEMIRLEQAETVELARAASRDQWRPHFTPGNDTGSLLERGIYAPCLQRVFDVFPRGQVHMIRFDDFRRDAGAEINRVLQWLGIPSHDFKRTAEIKGQSREIDVISPETRRFLSEYYAEFNRQLWELLGWEGAPWN